LKAQQRSVSAEFIPEFDERYQISIDQLLKLSAKQQLVSPVLVGNIRIAQAGNIIKQDQIQVDFNVTESSLYSQSHSFNAQAHKPYTIELSIQQADKNSYELKPNLQIQLDVRYMIGDSIKRDIFAVPMQFLGLRLMVGFMAKKLIAFRRSLMKSRNS
jgi:5-formaminoimidazole-4-carboxamide-1-beta-D-ribofuranosyl 5'-monophosphate synthetase